MGGSVSTGPDKGGLTASQASLFAICVVLGFLVLPASGAALELLLGPVRAQSASWVGLPLWLAASVFGGAIAGNAISGRGGRFPFSMAFLVFPLAAAVVVGQSIAFHDNFRWRQHEHVLDIVAFNVAYPMAFAGMSWAR
jgi:hypothetical protein